MKRIIFIIVCLTGLTFGSFAQNKQRPAAQSSARAKYVTATNHGAYVKRTHRKADGTLDRRYRTNHTTVVAVPMRRDGKKDMRYKVNKGKKN